MYFLMRWVKRLSAAMSMVLLVGFVVVISINVVLRNLEIRGLQWASEFSTYSNIWMVMLAGCGLAVDNYNICISGLQDHTKGRFQAGVRILVQVTDILFFGICTYSSYRLTVSGMTQFCSTMRWLPMGIVYCVMPVCFAIMTLIHVFHLAVIITNRKKEGDRP